MTMATETENNGPTVETKDIKDLKEMKDALKDEMPPDNKQDEATKESSNEKKEEAEKKSEDGANDATAAAAGGDASNAAAASAATAAAAAAPVKAPGVHKPNFEKDVVYLYQFPRTPLLPSLSSYCLKVETWLRLNGIKYENVDHKMKFRSKKGQLPFIELNGDEIEHSKIIMRELGQKYDKDIDAVLSTDQRSVSHATISMIENNLMWVVACWRTKNLDQMLKGYKVNLQHALGTRIPNGILNFFFKFTYGRKGARKVKAQGMGVHTAEEVLQFGCDDLKVLSDMLADKPFFFGDEPTALDVVAFANLAQILYIDKEISFALRDYMQENCPNLVGHCSRMKERCFPDWDEICSTLDMNTHLPKPEKTEEKEGKEEAKETKESKEEKEGDKEKADKEEKDVEKDKESDENKEKEKKGK
ncbi:PREDICTED: failed axon connections isoform X2 [Ceratosolen solmsi marchali]|uniref:Failed axon connections isoform X2 n=1 Tax=Ceratosolen solmsi marchali TaxID=326594 RepID=A0AAJ6YVN2_9HYME|nr:PREDICTED: failed axon connections isoform X2 [Ceratosolen solmsi marchali]